jgi:outer membrane protein TolC
VELSVKESPPNLKFKKSSNEKPTPQVALPKTASSTDLQKSKKTSNFQKLSESNKLKTNQPHGWDLLILRELVLQNAPELAIKKAQISTTQQSIPALEFGNYPNVKGKVSYNDYTKIASFQTWDSEPYGIFSYGVEGRWVLYDGHKTRKQIRTAELETEEAQWSLVVEEQKALRQLIEHFFNALNSQIELYFLRGIDRLIRERLVIYEKQVKSGIQDRMLLNKTIRELENLRSQKLIAEHSIQSSKSEISFLINADDQFWQSGKRFLSPPEFFLDYEFDPSSSAQVSLGKSAVKVAESKYDEIKSGMSPVFELTSNAGYKGKNKIGLDTQGQELSIGLSLTLPITDYYLTKSKLLKAREEIKQAEAKEYNLLRQQQNQYRSELLKLELAEKDYLLQKELWDLQKNRLEDMNFVSGRGLFDKSSALLEEEELLRRELSREQAKMKTIRHKYQLDLIE